MTGRECPGCGVNDTAWTAIQHVAEDYTILRFDARGRPVTRSWFKRSEVEEQQIVHSCGYSEHVQDIMVDDDPHPRPYVPLRSLDRRSAW